MSYIIFSIDNVTDTHTLAKFMRYIDTLNVMQKTKGSMQICYGSWEGVIEQSFIMRRDDFDKHVRHSGYVSCQESFLHVPADRRQPCVLEYQDGTKIGIGPMQSVTKEHALTLSGWTFNPKLNEYFAAG